MPIQPLQPKSIRNLGSFGVVRPASVDDVLIPDGAVSEAVNVHFDRIGATTVRPGMAGLGSSVATGYPIFGLHNLQNGSMIAVISQGGSARVYTYGGTAWSSNLTSGTANVKIRFVNFANRVVALNWGTATNQYSSMQVWSGITDAATWTTTGNPINPDNLWGEGVMPKFGEVYKSRMYTAGSAAQPDRLYYSKIINSSGNITWDASFDFVDINPNDGENITGLKRYSLELLVFKPNYIYRFKTSNLDPDPLIKVGTRSQESIIEGKRGLYFHHDSGFYRYSGSGYPNEISRPIADVVDAITYANYENVVGWKDSDHIYWSVRNLTVDGVSWPNAVCRYTESSDIWTVYSYANGIRMASDYNSGSALSRVAGLDNGVVATINSGTTDLGEPIKYRMITKWYEWEGVWNQKVIQEIIALSEKAQESELFYQTDDNIEWKTLGQLKKFVNYFQPLNIKFHRIRFMVRGTSRNEAPIFRGIEIPRGLNEGFVRI